MVGLREILDFRMWRREARSDLGSLRLVLRFIPQTADEQQHGCHADARIRNIESRPPTTAGRHDFVVKRKFEREKIHHLAFGQALPDSRVLELLQQESLDQPVC